jgi:hypothetical protein
MVIYESHEIPSHFDRSGPVSFRIVEPCASAAQPCVMGGTTSKPGRCNGQRSQNRLSWRCSQPKRWYNKDIYIYIYIYNLYTSRTRPWQPCSWRWAFARSHPGEPSVAWLHPTARWSSSSATVPKKSPPLLVDLQLKAMVYANKNATTKNLEWLGVY